MGQIIAALGPKNRGHDRCEVDRAIIFIVHRGKFSLAVQGKRAALVMSRAPQQGRSEKLGPIVTVQED